MLDLFDRLIPLGKTVLMVTHDPTVAARARRQIRLENGKSVTDPTVEKVGQP